MNDQVIKEYQECTARGRKIVMQMMDSLEYAFKNNIVIEKAKELSESVAIVKKVIDSISKLISCEKLISNLSSKPEEQSCYPYPPEAQAMMQGLKPSDFEFLKEALTEVFKE